VKEGEVRREVKEGEGRKVKEGEVIGR